MDEPLYMKAEPPYKWMKAYEFGDNTPHKRKLNVLRIIANDMPYYGYSSVKIVKVSCITADLVFDIGIYRNMSWLTFKEHAISSFKLYEGRLPFNLKALEDVTFSNTPYYLSPAIDMKKNDLFTVLADNSMIFFSQIKVSGSWTFFK